jgi:autotransporter passenger strand-loop-strand repeat protein
MTGTIATWISGNVGDWFDSNNWVSGAVPQAGDSANISAGTPKIDSGGEILGETITLGGAASGGAVALSAIDATFGPSGKTDELLNVTGGGSSTPVNATLFTSGTTTFDGQMIVEPMNGGLTISASPDSSGAEGNFEFLDTSNTLVLVAQESVLHLAGDIITNSAVIQIEGSLDVESGTILTGSSTSGGIVALQNTGHLSVHGLIASDQQIDFVDGTTKATIAAGGTVLGTFGFGGPTAAGARIDLQGVNATSETVSGNVMTLLSGGTTVATLNVQGISSDKLNPDKTADPVTQDFTLTSNGQGGTLITYTPQGPTVVSASMPAPIVAPTGSLVSLSSILGQSFGAAAPNYYGIQLISPNIGVNKPTDQVYWAAEVAPAWYINGVRITGNYVVQPGDNVQLLVGNNIGDPAGIQVQTTPTVTGDSGVYVNYSLWTVDPTVAAQVTASGSVAGQPTPQDVVNAAHALSALFPDIPNNFSCNSIADDVAAAAGATIPLPNVFYDPNLNAQGGFWRIAYKGSSSSNPPQDWSLLVEPGDIIRMQWFKPDMSQDEAGHSTTALSFVTSGASGELITFYDNAAPGPGGAGTVIGVHDDDYWERADPASITIFRLDPNQQYLISGSSQSEVIQGSVYNNLINPGGGADTITAGAGNNEIQDTTAHLNGITVTDFHLGDELDFTDLDPTKATVARAGNELLISSNGTQVAEINSPAVLPPATAFITTSDGTGGTLVQLTSMTADTWASGSSGDWSNAANWTSGVPDPTGYAVVNFGGIYTVSVTDDRSVGGLSIFNSAVDLHIDSRTLTVGTVVAGGKVDLSHGGTLDVLVRGVLSSTVSGTGTVALDGASGTVVTFDDDVGSDTKIAFTGASATLKLDIPFAHPDDIAATIDGFAFGETIDLSQVTFDSNGSATLLPGNVLHITEHDKTIDLRLDPSQSFAGSGFHLVSDGVDGTDVILDHVVSAGETVSVGAGDTVVGLTVLSGGIVDVLPGGTASATFVSNGGLLEVLSSGTVTGTNVSSGGTIAQYGGAIGSDTTIDQGGILQIGSFEVASGLSAGDDRVIDVLYSGIASSGIVTSDGTLNVSNGGVAQAFEIASGGIANVLWRGAVSNVDVDSGASLVVSSGGFAELTVISGGGSERIDSGATDDHALIMGGGSQVIESGGVASRAVISGGLMELKIGGSADGAITFAGATGTLQIDDTTMPDATIFGFQPGNMFDLAGVAFDPSGRIDLLTSNVLQVSEGGQQYDLQLDPIRDFSGKFFHLSSASGGGTLVTEDDVPCYCARTRIATTHGEVRVEELEIGDEVLTRSGAPRPIKWIGRRSYAGRFAQGTHVLPICFKADCLGPDQPHRDLWVSPNHAMFLEGVLIEARDLINGVSVTQAEHVEQVDYVHIELDAHDIIMAEGAWSESFVDDDSRAIFQNAHEYAKLYPDGRARRAQYCTPRVAFGPELEAARKQLAQRAGIPYVQPSTDTRPRALVVDSRVPQIGHDGGANAILDHMRALQAAGFEVSFLALDTPSRGTDVGALRSLGVKLLPPSANGSFNAFARAHAGAFDLVYLHRVESATRCLKAARRYFDASIVYSVADLHHLRLKAQSTFEHHRASELIAQAQTVAIQELSAVLAADLVITHSTNEAAQLMELPSIAAADKVRVVPWSVPVDPVRTPFAQRSGIAFVGNFAHAPNFDAARWLVDEIMPRVWREAPEMECFIIGSDMPEDFGNALVCPGVHLLGRIDRLSDVFERVRLTVAPLRFGAGLKDKVLRSMGADLPCVGTPEAFGGMPALPNVIATLCNGEHASDLAAAIVRLHRDEAAYRACAHAGLEYVAEFYSRSRVDALMRDVTRPALARRRSRAQAGQRCKTLSFGAPSHPSLSTARGPRRVVFN